MKNKLMVAIMALGMGMGIASTSAIAGESCRTKCNLANYHCNMTMNDQLCRSYVWACQACGGVLSI